MAGNTILKNDHNRINPDLTKNKMQIHKDLLLPLFCPLNCNVRISLNNNLQENTIKKINK